MEKSFLEVHQENMETLGFWDQQYKSTILLSIEHTYKTEVIREWCVADMVMNGDKVLVKWVKRHVPLTDEKLKEKYGRIV